MTTRRAGTRFVQRIALLASACVVSLVAWSLPLSQERPLKQERPGLKPGPTSQERPGLKPGPTASPVRFETDVYPIFQKSCFGCHGPQTQQAGLRLDDQQAFFKGGRSGPPVTPGNSEASVLLKRITGALTPAMPLIGDRLTPDQIARIRAWIDQGAPWPESTAAAAPPKHWAYLKPVRPPLPTVRNEAWARNAIDRFILARLEKEGLAPSPEANRATLIRRLSLDLTGLPPSPEEVDRFVPDRSPGAYERLVDRLLGSPHFGERWAEFWMDLARYADTNGYESDEPRTMWLWRDWVIRAFNRNLPFDQFSIEQIAGDLLPNSTEDQRIATGFHRNTLINSEAGAKDDEFRDAAVKDRVDVTAAVWLGSTLGCAQCHNHKYDPFTQKDYYRLYAIFNNTAESSIELSEEMSVFLGDRAELERRRAAIAPLAKVLDTPTPELAAAQAAWEERLRRDLPALEPAAAGWQTLEPSAFRSESGAALKKLDDGSLLAHGPNPLHDVYEVEFEAPAKPVTAVRLEVLPHASLPGGGAGRSENGDWVLTGLQVEAWSAEQWRRQADWLAHKPQWTAWYVLGPFEAPTGEEAHSTAYPPEREIDLQKTYENGELQWRERPEWKERVFNQLDGYNAATYLYRKITTPVATAAWVRVASDHGLQVWLNGKKLLATGALDEVPPEKGLLKLELAAGDNHLLMKYTNAAGYYRAYFQHYEGAEPERLVALDSVSADTFRKTNNATNLLDPLKRTGWAVESDKKKEPHFAIARFEAPVSLAPNGRLKVRLIQDAAKKGQNIGCFRLSFTSLAKDDLGELMAMAPAVRKALLTPAAERSDEEKEMLAAHYRSVTPLLAETRQKRDVLQKELDEFTEKHSAKTLVMRELPKPRETFVEIRGNFLTHGERVEPGVPAIFPQLPAEQPASRLALARWLFDPENPLTARVAVNHFWRAIFGHGLVRTAEDFGSQGDRPTHPEPLDWLAVEFRENGWDVKRLLRMMVLSSTYRQSSAVDEPRLVRDPENKLLSRAPRFRLQAEFIRDVALETAGLLSHKIGGPSVFPPLPPSVFENLFIETGYQSWPASQGEDRYRRGLYTFYKRTAVYPSFATFDAPERVVCALQRPRSDTPLQALTTLNDQVFVEAAGALARRLLTEVQGSARERVVHGFRLATARSPSAAEVAALLALHDKAAARYSADPAAARKLVSASFPSPPPQLAPSELAPWIVVANVLLNLDETVTKE